jgi:murein DD-endopeptidase MepM/ murein hydrolase activator NlpD
MQPTSYSAHHLGVDVYAATGEELRAPTKGYVVYAGWGTQGGWTSHFKDEYGKLWRFMHQLHEPPKGAFNEGDVIGYTDNTGMSDGPHLHCDISKDGRLRLDDLSNFIDPDLYIKEHTMEYKPNTIVFSKADKEYYWVRGDGKLLFIPHDRMIQAAMMAQSTPTEESLKDKSVGSF